MTEVERIARGMDNAARRAYLKARKWTDAHPCGERRVEWRPPGDRSERYYTLAAAVRVAVAAELAPQVADDPAAVPGDLS